MLLVRDLRAQYGPDAVLRGCDLDVGAGEVVAIFGRNGAGKTTLLRALTGALAAAGRIELAGQTLAGRSPEARFALGVTYMPQGHRVFGSLTAGENVLAGARLRGAQPWTTDELRARLPVVGARWHQPAATLSGGETQLVLLARALAGNGTLVLADEPAEGLDAQAVALLAASLRTAAERGAAVVVTDVREPYLRGLAGRAFELVDGTLHRRK